MKTISLSKEESDIAVEVITFLHRHAKTPEEKTDKFLIEKFGENAVELAKKPCQQLPTAEEIEEQRKKILDEVLKKYKKY